MPEAQKPRRTLREIVQSVRTDDPTPRVHTFAPEETAEILEAMQAERNAAELPTPGRAGARRGVPTES